MFKLLILTLCFDTVQSLKIQEAPLSQSVSSEPETSAWTRYFTEQMDSSDLEGGRRRRRRESDSTPTPDAATIISIAFKDGTGFVPQTPDVSAGTPVSQWTLGVEVKFSAAVTVAVGSCAPAAGTGCGTPFVLVRNSAGGSNAGCPTGSYCNGNPTILGTRGPYVVYYDSGSDSDTLTFSRLFPTGSLNYAGLGDILRVTGNIIQANSGTIKNTASTAIDAVLENAPTICTVELGTPIGICSDYTGSTLTTVPCNCVGGTGSTSFCPGHSGTNTCTQGNAAGGSGATATAQQPNACSTR